MILEKCLDSVTQELFSTMTIEQYLKNVLQRKEDVPRDKAERDSWTHDNIPQEDISDKVFDEIKEKKIIRTFIKLSHISANAR